jgi:hypothetical protein
MERETEYLRARAVQQREQGAHEVARDGAGVQDVS